MQYYFNNLGPIDNNTTPDECASIELMLYPNPTSNIFSIKSNFENCLFPTRIKIYIDLGQILSAHEVLPKPFPSIDMSSYLAGIYYVRIETFNKSSIKKIIKTSS